jgi:hypothetical protein
MDLSRGLGDVYKRQGGRFDLRQVVAQGLAVNGGLYRSWHVR